MSKGNSGLFNGTIGWNNSPEGREAIELAALTALMSKRAVSLDLQPHKAKMTIMSRKQMKSIEKKITSRTATKEEYKMYTWSKNMNKHRKHAVKEFWRQEKLRLLKGKKTTHNWTEEQRQDILKGKTPKFKGKALEGHHTYSVLLYPHLAKYGLVIYPATKKEHRQGWHGGNTKNSMPGRPIKYIMEF